MAEPARVMSATLTVYEEDDGLRLASVFGLRNVRREASDLLFTTLGRA